MGFWTMISPRARPHRAGRGGLPWIVGLVLACAGRGGGAGAAPDPEGVLWGGGKCQETSDCPTGLCSMGLCLGYLAASTEEARQAMAPVLRQVAAREGPQVERLLAEALADADTDPFVRGRAADAFRFLPAEAAGRVLPSRLQDPDEPVRFFAARALAEAGDPRGRRMLDAFRDHPSEAVRGLAARVLDPVASGASSSGRQQEVDHVGAPTPEPAGVPQPEGGVQP